MALSLSMELRPAPFVGIDRDERRRARADELVRMLEAAAWLSLADGRKNGVSRGAIAQCWREFGMLERVMPLQGKLYVGFRNPINGQALAEHYGQPQSRSRLTVGSTPLNIRQYGVELQIHDMQAAELEHFVKQSAADIAELVFAVHESHELLVPCTRVKMSDYRALFELCIDGFVPPPKARIGALLAEAYKFIRTAEGSSFVPTSKSGYMERHEGEKKWNGVLPPHVKYVMISGGLPLAGFDLKVDTEKLKGSDTFNGTGFDGIKVLDKPDIRLRRVARTWTGKMYVRSVRIAHFDVFDKNGYDLLDGTPSTFRLPAPTQPGAASAPAFADEIYSRMLFWTYLQSGKEGISSLTEPERQVVRFFSAVSQIYQDVVMLCEQHHAVARKDYRALNAIIQRQPLDWMREAMEEGRAQGRQSANGQVLYMFGKLVDYAKAAEGLLPASIHQKNVQRLDLILENLSRQYERI